MNRTHALLGLVFLLAGCDTRIEDARKRVSMAKKVEDYDEACRQLRVIQSLYLEKRDLENYRVAHSEADIYCQSVQLGIAGEYPSDVSSSSSRGQ